MKKLESELNFRKDTKPDEKTPLLKMRGDINYTQFHDEEDCTAGDEPWECCSWDYIISVVSSCNWRSIVLTLCSCYFWYHVLLFILFPLAIYCYWSQIVDFFYHHYYGDVYEKAADPTLGPKVKRLRNLGNTCFFNSMNQSVNQTVLLLQMLRDLCTEQRTYTLKPEKQEEQLEVQVDSEKLTKLTNEAHNLYCIKINKPLWYVTGPRGLLKEISNRNPRFGRRREEDSHEALRCLLDGLRMEEIDKIKDQVYEKFGVTKDPASQVDLDGESKLKLKLYLREAAKQCVPVDKVFGGIQVSTTICRVCHTPLQNNEKFLDLSLPLPEKLVEIVGTRDHCPPVINHHDGNYVENSTFDGKVSPSPEKSNEEATNDAVYKKQPIDQSDIKESLEDSHDKTEKLLEDFTHDPSDDRDTKPNLIDDIDHESNIEDTSKVDCLSNEVDDNHDASELDTAVEAVDPTSKLQGEEYEKQETNVDGANNRTDINNDPKTQSFDKQIPSQEKSTDDQDFIGVNPSTDAENFPPKEKPNPNVALTKAELHKYLESKDLLYQISAEHEKEKDPQSLEAVLTEYTALDVLDEDNKFICTTCNKNRTKPLSVTDDDGDNDEPILSLVSKQIALHQLPPVLIMHLKRFSIEPDGIHKDNQHIKFPFKLNMSPYCTTQCIKEMGDCNQEILYGLYAVVIHDGNTLEHGHYFAYVRRRPPINYSSIPDGVTWKYDDTAAEGGTWFYASDVTVHCCDQGFDEVKEKKAYMLFYEILPKKAVTNTP